MFIILKQEHATIKPPHFNTIVVPTMNTNFFYPVTFIKIIFRMKLQYTDETSSFMLQKKSTYSFNQINRKHKIRKTNFD